MTPLPPAPPLRVSFLRLFTVQASWNYDRLLGVGMGVAEEPLLRALKGDSADGAAYQAAVARGARFFNAHPYLCGLAVGATARAEYDGAPPEEVERLRSALCGPLGALGARWWAAVVFLLVYNAGHVALRWWALRAGWAAGTGVASALRHPVLQRPLAFIVPAMAFAAGVCLPLAAGWLVRPFPLELAVAGAAVAAAAVTLLRWLPGRVKSLWVGLAAVALGMVGGWLWR